MFIRRKFSGSNFLSEIREHGATCFIYIGELCRYLLNVPATADDHHNPLISMMGNGLRPDVWHEFKARFGIKRIAEFYGSSEGNVAFVNMLNKDCTVGTTSMPVALVKYDVDADEIARDAQGRLYQGGRWRARLAARARLPSTRHLKGIPAVRTRRRRSCAMLSRKAMPGSIPAI